MERKDNWMNGQASGQSKGIVVKPGLVGDTVKGGKMESCVNLSRDEAKGVMEVMRMPGRVGHEAGLPIVVMGHRTAGRIGWYQAGERVKAVYLDEGGRIADVCGVRGSLRCGVVTGPDRVVLMSEEAPLTLRVDEEGVSHVITDESLLPKLRFDVEDELELTESFSGGELTGDYSMRRGPLTTGDASRLTKDMLGAYKRLVAKGSAEGRMTQPFMVRYRYIGEEGSTLYVSAPTMVMTPSGMQMMGGVTMSIGDGYGSRGGGTLRADSYKVKLKTIGNQSGANADAIKELVVEATVMIHPVDLNGTVMTNIVSTSGNPGTLHAYLPGSAGAVEEGASTGWARAKGMIDRSEGAFKEVKRVYRPFAAGVEIAESVTAAWMERMSVDAEVAETERLMQTQPTETGELEGRCRVPHKFTAKTGTNVGETVVWGNLTPRRFNGYGIEELATEVSGTQSWQGAVEVIMATGEERVVAVAWGTRGAPLKLSGLLSYPSGDAVMMRVTMRRGMSNYKSEFALRRAADGQSAYYLSRGMRPIELAESGEAFVFPTATEHIESRGNGLISCRATDALNALSGAMPCTSAITAVAAVDRRGGSWEYGRRRVYVMTQGGTMLANIDLDGCWATFHRFDSRGVSGQEAVTETTDDRYPVVMIAGRDLVGLSRGSMKTLLSGLSEQMIGWDGERGMLWIADGEGEARVMQGIGGGITRFTAVAVRGISSGGNSLLISDGSGLRDTAKDGGWPMTGGYVMKVDAPWSGRGLWGMRLKAVEVGISGEGVAGQVSVSDLNGEMLVRGSFSGRLSGSVKLRTLTPPIAGARISVSVSGTSAIELGDVRLVF